MPSHVPTSSTGPIQLRALGVLDLRDGEGRELGALLRQPKRLALLAYLAVASPRRHHRRDSLLALFWPELDEGHARAALRRALYFVRGVLGPGVVVSRGEDEVGLAEERFWCDATELERAADRGDLAGALELYRGDLLEGLFVEGAPGCQDWLDRERNRLRERAAAAARMLGDQAAAAGDVAAAAGWARRGLELMPLDEGALLRLVALLDRAGDRSAALRTYDAFARRFVAELDVEPSAAVRSAVERLREGAAAPVAIGSGMHQTGSLRGAEGDEAIGSRRGNPIASSPAAPRNDPGVVAVLPFSVRGDPRFGYLAEGMVDLLATKLDGAGDLRTVDPRALLAHLAREPRARLDPAAGHAVAERFGAGLFLLGSLVEAGGRIQASATLYQAAGSPVATALAEADEAGLFGLVDDLARQLLGAHPGRPAARFARLAALTTDSLPALRAYLGGERELRAGRYFDAMAAFEEAVAADGSFALAHYRLAAAAAGCALPDLARQVADAGFGHRTRLAEHDRLLFAAQRAWLHGAVAEAESLYVAITSTYPDDVEAWFHLGDLLFHSNPLRGRSTAEAREPFERVLRLEPDHAGALVHLARIAALEGRDDERDALAGRALAVSPEGDQALAMRALRAFGRRDAAEMARVRQELAGARALTVAIAFADVALYARDLDGAETIARSFVQVARSAELRALCHILLAHLALARERWTDARDELARAEALDPTWGLEMRALVASMPFVPASEAELAAVRDAMAAWRPSPAATSGFLVFAMHEGLHPGLMAYLSGLVELRLGNVAKAAAAAERLAALDAEAEGRLRDLVDGLRARVAAATDGPAAALRILEASAPALWFQLTVASPFFSLAGERFLRAELLRALGRDEEALGWLESLAQRSPYELPWAAAARSRATVIARARSARGDRVV